MNIHALIIEQLEWDGLLKSFTIQSNHEFGQMWVAFPNEYDNVRNSPYHFLDSNYENLFEEKSAKCKSRRLTEENFYIKNNHINFTTTWNQIPTDRHGVTFYSLYLPEFAIPNEIAVTDTYQPQKQFSKTVYRDDAKKRFIIYIECRSSVGIFNFKLQAKFYRDEQNFARAQFTDNKTVGFYEQGLYEHWRHMLPEGEAKKVSNFFTEQVVINQGDFEQSFKPIEIKKNNNPWISGSFYLVVAITAMTGLAVISKTVHWSLFPIIIIGGIFLIGVVGAFQLKNDDKLKDESFLKLMTETYKRLPLLKQSKGK
jgi:hypothetical protein